MPAGRIAIRRLDDLMSQRASFAYETMLSSRQAMNVMRRARREHYQVGLAFVVLQAPELNVARVRQRVFEGGHDIPTGTILRRYELAVSSLAEAIPIAHETVVFDNTAVTPVSLIEIRKGVVMRNALEASVGLHVRIAQVVATALNCEMRELLVASGR